MPISFKISCIGHRLGLTLAHSTKLKGSRTNTLALYAHEEEIPYKLNTLDPST